MQPLFSIFKTRGDGSLHLVEETESLESAKEQVEELAEFWPGTYVILNQATKETLTVTTGGDTKFH